jgi:cytochrome c oxidase subunit 2
MLGMVHVVDAEGWQKYLDATGGRPESVPPEDWGRDLFAKKACVTCHSLDGSRMTGPTFQELFGSTVTLSDGSPVTVDEEYLRRSIVDPASQVVAGYEPVMPTFTGLLTPDDIDALVAFIKQQ